MKDDVRNWKTHRGHKALGIATTALIVFFLGAVAVQGTFVEPAGSPPSPTGRPDEGCVGRGGRANQPCDGHVDISKQTQNKVGNIGANNLWLNLAGRWASQLPLIKIKHAKYYDVSGAGRSAIAYCDEGYELLSCSGTMGDDARGFCGSKGRCGLVGIIPVDKNGTRAVSGAVGCKVGVDLDGGASANAYAFCRQKAF